MKSRNETGFEQLPSDLMLRINQLCDRYESELRLGELPSIDDYLEHIAVEYRDVILRELIPLEMEHRCQLGESPDATEYLELYPGLDPDWLASSLKTTQTELLAATGISTDHKQQSLPEPVLLEQCQQRIVKEGILSQEELTKLQEASAACQTSEGDPSSAADGPASFPYWHRSLHGSHSRQAVETIGVDRDSYARRCRADGVYSGSPFSASIPVPVGLRAITGQSAAPE